MKNTNFAVIEEHVGTQYGDLTGIVQIDGHNTTFEMNKFCESKGIDLNKYFLIGIGISIFDFDEKENCIYCSFYFLEKTKYGNNFDEIEKNIKNIPIIDVLKKDYDLSFKELGIFIKRFDALLFNELNRNMTKINISDLV